MTSHGQGLEPIVSPDAPEWLPGWLEWFHNIGSFVVNTVFGTIRESFPPNAVVQIFVFLLILTSSYYIGKLARWGARRTLFQPPRVDAALGRLLGHFIIFVFLLLGFSAGLGLFGTSLAAIATGLGLLTLALGFGMQNTVANLMGGISLAVDKPFRIGDRIQVGEYWGTVQLIGLRSTRIVTPRKETVLVPNKIMEEREIWNYTLSSPEYRLDINVGISYDSDWKLAERIMLAAADTHPNILHYPPSRVVMQEFAESSVHLQLRAWIADVTLRADTISDILKAVKDRFDAEGVELPFPYRTIVYKNDIKEPARLESDIKPFSRVVEGMKEKILVAVAGPQPVRERAAFVASLAKGLSAGVVALYIERPGVARREEGEDALRLLGESVRAHRIWYKPVVRSGAIVPTIRNVAREEDVDLILVGAGRGSVSNLWRRSPEVGSQLRHETSRPVFTVPRDLKLSPQLVTWLKEQMRIGRNQREGVDDEEAAPAPPPPSESTPPEPEPGPADAPAEDGNPPEPSTPGS